MSPVVKNLYRAKFRHINEEIADSALNIIAATFDEALKKANDSSERVSVSKDDRVELVGIEMICSIDVE